MDSFHFTSSTCLFDIDQVVALRSMTHRTTSFTTSTVSLSFTHVNQVSPMRHSQRHHTASIPVVHTYHRSADIPSWIMMPWIWVVCANYISLILYGIVEKTLGGEGYMPFCARTAVRSRPTEILVSLPRVFGKYSLWTLVYMK